MEEKSSAAIEPVRMDLVNGNPVMESPAALAIAA
jgi:hypothetical protein